MKIGIISDTHGSATAWSMAYEKYLMHTEQILHAGDVLYHGPRNQISDGYGPSRLAAELNACPVPLLAARGNCDSEVDASVLEMPLASPYAFAVLNGRRVLVTHGHFTETREEQYALAEKLKADIFVSGHTHISLLERRGSIVFVNPGSPSLSKRSDGRSTLALMDEREISVIDIYTGEVLDKMLLSE